MNNTIDQCLSVYKQKLMDYLIWKDEVEKEAMRFGLKPSELEPIKHYDRREWAKFIEWNTQLEIMEESLGLTKEESETLLKEARNAIKKD